MALSDKREVTHVVTMCLSVAADTVHVPDTIIIVFVDIEKFQQTFRI